MFMEFIPLSLACTRNPNLACAFPDMHTCIVHTSSVYMRVLHSRFDVTNLACRRRLARV